MMITVDHRTVRSEPGYPAGRSLVTVMPIIRCHGARTMYSLSPVEDVDDYELRRSDRTQSAHALNSSDGDIDEDINFRRSTTPPMSSHHHGKNPRTLPSSSLLLSLQHSAGSQNFPAHNLHPDGRADDVSGIPTVRTNGMTLRAQESLEKRINSVDNMIQDIKKILPHANWDQLDKQQQQESADDRSRGLNRVSFDEDMFLSQHDRLPQQPVRQQPPFADEALEVWNNSSPLDREQRQQVATKDQSHFVQAGEHEYSLPVARDLSSRRDYLDLAHQTFLGALNPVKFVLNEFAPEEDEKKLFARAGELYLQVTRQLFESQAANAKMSKAISVMAEENKTKFGEMEKEIVTLRNENFELQNKLDEKEAEFAKKFERVIREGNASLSDAHAEISRLSTHVGSVQAENQKMREKYEGAVSALNNELQLARSKIAADAKTIDTLQAKIDLLEKDLTTLSEDFAEISQQRDDCNEIEKDFNVARMSHIEKMRSETCFLNNYRDDVVGMDRQLHALLQDNLELAKNCSSLHADLMVVTEGRASLQRQFAFHLNECEKGERRLRSDLKKARSLLLFFIGVSRKEKKFVAYEGWISEWLYRRHIRQRVKILVLAHKRRWWKKFKGVVRTKSRRDLRSVKASDLSKMFATRNIKCIFTDWRVVHRIRRLSRRFQTTYLNPFALLSQMIARFAAASLSPLSSDGSQLDKADEDAQAVDCNHRSHAGENQ
eukprot:624953-Hanusia_phi.AAC.1